MMGNDEKDGHLGPEVGASEQFKRQEQALQIIRGISRRVGADIPIQAVPGEMWLPGDEEGMYIMDDDVSFVGPVDSIEFDVQPRMLSGAADSAHAVLAGQLKVEYPQEEREYPIAAKCYQKRTFDEKILRAQRETSISRFMRDKGELYFSPVAVAISKEEQNGAVVLFTELQDVYTLDSNPWNRGPNGSNKENAEAAAKALGRFNAYGFCHGDAKIKNVASCVAGTVSMIDFETTTQIDLHNPLDVAGAVHKDFGLLLASLVHKGLFTPKYNDYGFQTNAEAISNLLAGMVDAYMQNWQDSPVEVGMMVYDTLQESVRNTFVQNGHLLTA